jgi:hypothetical protein
MKFGIRLYGYEHIWDNEEIIRFKTNNYGRMIDKQAGRELKTPEQYFDNYVKELEEVLKVKNKSMPIEVQPKIIQDKLRSVNQSHFGFSFFKR